MFRPFRLIDAALLSGIGLSLVACSDAGGPTAPKGQFRSDMITCQVSVSAGSLTCASSQVQAAPGINLTKTLGGQGALVRLASSGTVLSAGTLTSDVTVENLLSQPMNTTNGTTPDAGVNVFFYSGPTTTGGTGTVSVANQDGIGTFTASGQKYFLYSAGAILAPGATTAPKSWHFTVPTTVTTFAFEVFVSTTIPDEASPLIALGLSRTPSALTIAPGGNGTTTINLTRTNFTGAVTLGLSGAPTGVTGSFSPSAPTGTSSTLTLSATLATVPGVYHLTVNGTTGSIGNRSTALTLTVGTGGTGNVTVDFSSCPVADRAVWVAAKDGANPWARVTGTGDVYTFTIGAGGGGLAYVVLGANDASSITVQYFTQAQFTTGGTLVFCPPPATGKTINGSVANVAPTDMATVSLGGSTASVFGFGALTFQLTGVPSGAQDLVAYRQSLIGGAESAIIRRSQNIADNGTIATLDFGAVEAFTPATALITLNGLLGGEQISQSMFYQVGANCATATLYGGVMVASSPFTASGIPGAHQLVTDFHGLNVFAFTGTASRLITQYNNALAPRTLTLGAVMPSPTITDLGGAFYKRLQATYTLPTDYEGSTSFGYTDGANKSVDISATFGYLGGTSTTLALPDFSALAGWDNTWAPANGGTADWSLSGASAAASQCTEGATFKSASETGTF